MFSGHVRKSPHPKDNRVSPRLKNIIRKCISFGVPIVLTVGLVWYMFTKVPFAEMMQILRGPVDYWWILLAMGLSVFSHVFRALRWRIQLRSLGMDVPLMALCCSVFGCYSLNLLFPRLGEVWRCTYVSRRAKAPFATVLGSLVADRAADALAVLLMLLLALAVAFGSIVSFLDKFSIGRNIISILTDPVWWVAGTAGLVMLGAVVLLFRHTRVVSKGRRFAAQIWHGFASVLTMKGRVRFALLTILLWGCYFIQLYVAFFAFGFTRRLCSEPGLAYGLIPCLVAFVLSSFGMAVPSNGGLGPWNIAIMFGLALYGVTDSEGVAFSMLQWSGQTVMLILLGIFTMIYITVTARKDSRPDVVAGQSKPETT